MEKEINIVAPEGYEIDKENSTFECIKFKPIEKKRWRYDRESPIAGFYISPISTISCFKGCYNVPSNYNVFATEKQAKSALAMARISQIMANDERFGGVITDEEWESAGIQKWIITKTDNRISKYCYLGIYYFLAFHTEEQRELFLQENEDLVRDYLML